MIDILDEITEIPFDVFWDKFQEMKEGIYNRDLAEKEWFYMKEEYRIMSFKALSNNHPILQIVRQPYEFLQHFNLPF